MRTATYTETLTGQEFTAVITKADTADNRYNVSVNGVKLGWLTKSTQGWTVYQLARQDDLTASPAGITNTLDWGAWELMQRSPFLYAAQGAE